MRSLTHTYRGACRVHKLVSEAKPAGSVLFSHLEAREGALAEPPTQKARRIHPNSAWRTMLCFTPHLDPPSPRLPKGFRDRDTTAATPCAARRSERARWHSAPTTS
eukprot:366055-Chlamydomonas_euryale.AAC.16